MVWIPALSLQEQVERVGAYVGIASFFGIALLAILYFAQARELKRLRDWAGRAPERARELEERVAEDAARRADEQVRTVPAAGSAAPVAATEAPAATVVATAGASNGTAATQDAGDPGGAAPADATAAAVPDQASLVGESDADGATVVGSDGADEAGTLADAADAGAGTGEPSPAAGTDAAGTPPVAAGTDAAGTPPVAAASEGETPAAVPVGSSAGSPEEPEPVAPGDGDGSAGDGAADPVGARPASAVRAGPRPATAAALRVGAQPTRVAPRPAPPLTPVTAGPRRRGRGVPIALGVVGALAAAGGAFALSTGGDEDPASESNVAQTPTATPTATSTQDVAAARQATTVAVFNGTTTNGLAARLVERLAAAGYQEGPRGNYADQQRATSVVLYREGAADRARDVASVLDIADVAPIDAPTAAQPIGDAQVVVVAGLDQAP